MPVWSGSVRSCELTQSFALLGFLRVSCFCGKEEFGHVARCVCVCGGVGWRLMVEYRTLGLCEDHLSQCPAPVSH